MAAVHRTVLHWSMEVVTFVTVMMATQYLQCIASHVLVSKLINYIISSALQVMCWSVNSLFFLVLASLGYEHIKPF